MLSATFDDRGGGANDLPFPWTSPASRPFSAALKFYKFSMKIAIPLRVILIPLFHYGPEAWNMHVSINLTSYTSRLNQACESSTTLSSILPYQLRHCVYATVPVQHLQA